MKLWMGVTDTSWFSYLAERTPDEVNFWQPLGGNRFSILNPGEPFLFKLKRTKFIVGGGFFVRHSILPLSLAWEAFEQKNGAVDFGSFRSMIMNIRSTYQRFEPDPMIGCIILANPFFLHKDKWIPIPENWSSNIVKGKTYDTSEPVGAALWKQVHERLIETTEFYVAEEESLRVAEDNAVYGSEYLARARLGQGAFRILVTEVYKRKCAITGERTLPVLEAAHIKPYSLSGPHRTNNGLLLRSDLHKLFDLGYLTITNDFHVEISKRIKEEYHNGREYYQLHGNELVSLPSRVMDRPLREFIDWHNQNVYKS